ncbi:hypothetical protein HA142_03720 [Prochlorococcus marinus str. XMU1401]|uniref:Uncharacterized protein n=1 Tax=Prochlorococcus marinus str. XMU1401 TaxID=2052594 RepID=A0A8I1X2I6_PROMR|nr:hypothetical protein [Prochlorococcus marinus]MBO8222613.1 hypothetical protein [Prochlorococcus marinus str. XMU1401]MCQ9197757.1 hypothetical protein [Prochlorococcus marinus XMU1429]
MNEVTSNSSSGWYLIALVSTLSFLAKKDRVNLERIFRLKKALQLHEMQSF